MVRRLFTILSVFVSLPLAAAGRQRAVEFPRPFPPCSMITGTAAVTFTRDQGVTLMPTAERLSGIGYTYGLAALDVEGTLLAWHRSDLILSTDHGCSWRVVASFNDYDFPPRITAAKGGRAYAWADNRTFLVRYDSRGAVRVKQPVAFIGIAVDRADADHVRAGGSDGSIWESHDGAESWTQIGSLKPASRDVIFYRIAFDPANLDHIVAGVTTDGAYVSFDGGRTWQASKNLSGRMNAFELAISPADPNVVWAEALDLGQSLRHVYFSRDGGVTFRAVVDESPDVQLFNGNLLVPHPKLPDVLYFVFGTYFQNYGTDLFRYDAASGALTVTHNDFNDVNSIAFSPVRPNLMYLGLEVESGVR